MPSSGGKNDRKIVEAVKSGELDEKILDRACERIIKIIFATRERVKCVYDRAADHKLAREIAAECMVLLKNDGILPLAADKKYAFIGKFAKAPRHQGGGSSHINTYKVVGAWDAAEGIDKIYADGYTEKDEVNAALIAEAVETAKKADVAIVFAGLTDAYESEGFDRTHIDMPAGHVKLIEAVAEANPNTVVVLHNGSPVSMPWLPKVKGVLEAYLGGEASGEAVYDILFGKVNPSGKLPETFPVALEDVAASAYFPGGTAAVQYREGLYVGYRYFDKAEKPVLFPFGYGLSYTEFGYSDLKIKKPEIDINAENLELSFTVENTGKVFGKEAVQVYVADKVSSVYRPVKELKAFDKVALEPGEKKTVSFSLDKRAFAYYDVKAQDWKVESGEFEILVGASSRDIRLEATVNVKGDADAAGDDAARLPSYYGGKVEAVSDAEFEALLGKKPLALDKPADYKLDYSSTFEDAKRAGSGLGKFIAWLIPKCIKDNGLGSSAIMVAIIMQTPIRAMSNMSGGLLSDDMAAGLIMLFNREHRLKAWGKIFKGVFLMGKHARLAKENKL